MNYSWVKLLIASILEVGWVIGLAHANNFLEWTGTIIAIIVCNYLLISATKVLPTGTSYTVFVGLGTAGAVISEILFFNEPFNVIKVSFIVLLLIGVIGLKIVTDSGDEKEVDS